MFLVEQKSKQKKRLSIYMVFNFLYTKHAEYFSVLKAIIPVS